MRLSSERLAEIKALAMVYPDIHQDELLGHIEAIEAELVSWDAGYKNLMAMAEKSETRLQNELAEAKAEIARIKEQRDEARNVAMNWASDVPQPNEVDEVAHAWELDH